MDSVAEQVEFDMSVFHLSSECSELRNVDSQDQVQVQNLTWQFTVQGFRSLSRTCWIAISWRTLTRQLHRAENGGNTVSQYKTKTNRTG